MRKKRRKKGDEREKKRFLKITKSSLLSPLPFSLLLRLPSLFLSPSPLQQTYAHLYEWDGQKRIDPNPWARAGAGAVLSAVRKYARETGVAAATSRGARVTAVTECFSSTGEERRPGGLAAGGGGGFFVDYELDVGAAAREQAEKLRSQGIGVKNNEAGGEVPSAGAATAVIERRRLKAATVIVATGTLGRPMSPEDRGLPSTDAFKGVICNACRHEEERSGGGKDKTASSSSTPSSSPLAEGAPAIAGKKVVVLGSGAFALEAVERAAFCGAESVTIVCRPDEQLRERKKSFFIFIFFLFARALSRSPDSRSLHFLLFLTPEQNTTNSWVVPFSRQLLFVLLVTVLLPRAWAYGLARHFARAFYKLAGIEALAPPERGTGPQLFRGQCCDGWFFLQRAGLLRVTTEKIVKFSEKGVVLEREGEVEADVLVVARE